MLFTITTLTTHRFTLAKQPALIKRKYPVLAIVFLFPIALFCTKKRQENERVFIADFFYTGFKIQEIKTNFSSQKMFQKIKNTPFALCIRKQAAQKESLLPQLGFLFHKWQAMA